MIGGTRHIGDRVLVRVKLATRSIDVGRRDDADEVLEDMKGSIGDLETIIEWLDDLWEEFSKAKLGDHVTEVHELMIGMLPTKISMTERRDMQVAGDFLDHRITVDSASRSIWDERPSLGEGVTVPSIVDDLRGRLMMMRTERGGVTRMIDPLGVTDLEPSTFLLKLLIHVHSISHRILNIHGKIMAWHGDGQVEIDAERMSDGLIDVKRISGFTVQIIDGFVPDQGEDRGGYEDGEDATSIRSPTIAR